MCEVLAQPHDDLQFLPLSFEGAARQQVRRLHGHKVADGGRAQLEVKLQGAQVVLRHFGEDFLQMEKELCPCIKILLDYSYREEVEGKRVHHGDHRDAQLDLPSY